MTADKYALMIKAEKKLRVLTINTAHSFAMWNAANEFIKFKQGSFSNAIKLADDYRQDAANMTIIGLYALFERKKELSYQAVYQHLKCNKLSNYLLHERIGNNHHLESIIHNEFSNQLSNFRELYQSIPWQKHGAVQGFRNTVVAHLANEQFQGDLRYGDVEKLMRLTLQLSDSLHNLIGQYSRDSLTDYDETKNIALKRWQSLN